MTNNDDEYVYCGYLRTEKGSVESNANSYYRGISVDSVDVDGIQDGNNNEKILVGRSGKKRSL